MSNNKKDEVETPKIKEETPVKGVEGMYIRNRIVKGKIKSTYFIRARDENGRRKKKKIANVDEMKLADAKKLGEKLRLEIRTSVRTELEGAGDKTLRELIKEIVETKPSLKERTKREYIEVPEKYAKVLIKRKIKGITLKDIKDWYSKEKAEARKEYAFRILNSAFNYAVQMQYITTNPFNKFTAMKLRVKRKARKETLDHTLIQKWLAGILKTRSIVGRDLLIFILSTGFRFGEASSLTWAECDMKNKIITLSPERTKNKTEFKLPMSNLVYSILMFRKREDDRRNARLVREGKEEVYSDYVFPSPADRRKPVNDTRKVRKLGGDLEYTNHDLRRTYITLAGMVEGIPDRALKDLLNHTHTNITEQYRNPQPEYLRPWVNRISALLNNQLELVAKVEINTSLPSSRQMLRMSKEDINNLLENNTYWNGEKIVDDGRASRKFIKVFECIYKTDNALEATIYRDTDESHINIEVNDVYKYAGEMEHMNNEFSPDDILISERIETLQEYYRATNSNFKGSVRFRVKSKDVILPCQKEAQSEFDNERCFNFSINFKESRYKGFIR